MNKFVRIRLLLLCICTGLSTAAFTQSVTISGKVIAQEDGSALPGVAIQEKGTSNGTITDTDGEYSLSVNEGATLVFSYIGYVTEERAVGNQSTIDVTLVYDLVSLEEVTVIGYGTAQKKEITGAVVGVDSASFNRGNINDPEQLLQGKVAGLSIARPGGDPNAGYTVRLRGLSTFGANAEPLVVIDGVLGGSLQLVDPNDIQSIEVLKDASAAAIYGTRGASGVIIVTTKKPKGTATPQIDFNAYVAAESIQHTIETATRDESIEAGGSDLGSDTDWLDLVTRTGVSHVYNLSISSGFGSGSYRASINSRNVEGVAKNSGFDQINARVGLTQRAIKDKLEVTLNFSINKRNARFIPYQTMRYAIIADPTAPIYNNNNEADGYWEPSATPEYQNPYGISNEVTDDGIFKTQQGNARVEYELLEGLNLGAFYSLQTESDLRSQYFSSKTRFTGVAGGRATKFTEDRNNELFELTSSFKRQFNTLGLNAVAGYSWQKLTFENFSAENTNFITDELLYNALELGLGTATGQENQASMFSQKEESILISFFARAILNLDDTYFLSAAIRREGSSKFGENNRWGNFYSVSGGADLAQVLGIPSINMLKLRVGYGVTGNLPNQNYEYLVRLTRGARSYFNNQRYLQGVNYASNPNPDLKWEEKAEANFGVDFELLDRRLTGSIDYYIRNTTDVLQPLAVSVPPNLFEQTLLNIGELKSNGLEIAVNYGLLDRNDMNINTGIVFSTNTTELVQLDGEREEILIANLGPPGLNNTNVIRLAEGERIGDIMAPIYIGLNEDGTRNIVDQNEDGVIDQENDAVVAGNGLPDFELAWNTSISWKSFDFSMVWRGAFGHQLVNINRAYYESPEQARTGNIVRTKYYLPELTEAEDWNDYYVEDADFLKLDNISIGWSPNIQSDAIRNLRFYITGQNLLVFTDYTGIDPEVHYTYGGNNLAPGIDDRSAYFRTRTVSVGVNVGF